MALSAGTRLGPYEITGVLGAGGMGEVYRARDSALGRDVALKVLPSDVANDRERLGRFAREARVLASLNHPNIGAIHGWEESTGVHAIVLELIEGPTLRDRILAGPLPIDQALGIARQIADGLEAAHDQGIVHRDLKPANIKVRSDGRVKVLDFGLAKALQGDQASAPNESVTTVAATRSGIALGTPAYMSPEQARGETVTRKTDVWSFGVVLFEMLSGRHPFGTGPSTEVVAAILRATPEWEALPAGTPPAVTRLLRRCLEKDPRSRIHDIGDARLEIEDAISGRSSSPSGSNAATGGGAAHGWSRSTRIVAAIGALVVVAVVAAAYFLGGRGSTPSADMVSLSIVAPVGTRFQNTAAVSPDGKVVAFVASSQGAPQQLWIRTLSSQVTKVLPGTDGAKFPFWSPNSGSIAFFADGKLKRTNVAGDSPPIPICDAELGRGGAWIDENTIVFAPAIFSPLMRVTVASGQVFPLTTLDKTRDVSHRFPSRISDKYLAYGATLDKGYEVRLIALDAPDRIIRTYPIAGNVEFANGFLLFVRGNQLVAQRLHLPDGELVGEMVQMGAVRTSETAGRSFWSSSASVLVLPGPFTQPTGQFTWVSQDGRVLGTLGQPEANQGVELSPDGLRVVTIGHTGAEGGSVRVLDTTRGVPSSVTNSPSLHPLWSWDGSRLAYMSSGAAPPNSGGVVLMSAPWAGGGTTDVLRQDPSRWFNPVGWTQDGTLVWVEAANGIWQMSPSQPASAKQYLEQEKAISNAEARLSRDGRWIAYASDQSGDFDIIVQAFPSKSGRWTASSHGGRFPRWSADGHELYYLTRDLSELMAVSVTGEPPVFGTPHEMFKVNLRPIPIDSVVFSSYEYDVDSKNSRFIINQLISEPPQTLDLVLNWMRK
jgi:Tol biopolymer transport system component